jgi:hypothetical protein
MCGLEFLKRHASFVICVTRNASGKERSGNAFSSDVTDEREGTMQALLTFDLSLSGGEQPARWKWQGAAVTRLAALPCPDSRLRDKLEFVFDVLIERLIM